MGAKYFDKRYGSGASDYFIGSPDHFDMQTFSTGGYTAYLNPRTGSFDQNDRPINGAGFHWFAYYSLYGIRREFYISAFILKNYKN